MFPDPVSLRVERTGASVGRIKLPKLGWMKLRGWHELPGEISNITVSRRAGQWFAAVQCEREVAEPVASTLPAVGIDMGVAIFAALSDGTTIAPANHGKRALKALRRAQRAQSRKKRRNTMQHRPQLQRLPNHDRAACLMSGVVRCGHSQLCAFGLGGSIVTACRLQFGSVALLGPNGAGKTTLIGCLLGFLLPSSGTVRLFGENATELRPELRGRTGFVPQKMGGFTAFRVGELIKYLGRFYPRGPGEIPAWLLNWAELDMKARVKSLSGGQKQRLSILLAMRHEPDLLVLDEPVASLDLQARLDFMGLLSEYCAKEERSAIISSHILSDLEKMVTRAIFMRRGAVVHDTPMKDFRRTTRWVSAPVAMEVLRAALPKTLSLLAEARESGALLVNGWNADVAGALHQALGVAVVERQPDLETAFLEMTR